MRFMKSALALASALSLLLVSSAHATDDTVTAKNAAGSTVTFCSKDTGSGVMASCSQLIKPDGTKITPRQETAEPAGENHVGEVGGHTTIVGATFTTTATTTALTDGQLLANNATAGSVTPLDFSGVCRVNQGTGMIRRARVKIPDTGLAGKSLWLKLYRDSPTPTNGDHGTWLTTESNFIGQISVTLDQHFSDPYEKGLGAPSVGSEINFDCASASTHLYGLIVANGASATLQGSKVLTAVLEVLVN